MAREITNYDDIIDSRDVIERIKELEEEIETVNEEGSENDLDVLEELAVLKALAEQGSASPDWKYGETLIRDSYFREYAEELAEEIGAIDSNASWPNTYIDWDRAADALKQDYMTVDFDGVLYWVR